MIRNFMRATFPAIINILFVISIAGVVIAAFSAGKSMFGEYSFALFISVLLPGIIGVVVGFGIIYVLLDIRDALENKN